MVFLVGTIPAEIGNLTLLSELCLGSTDFTIENIMQGRATVIDRYLIDRFLLIIIFITYIHTYIHTYKRAIYHSVHRSLLANMRCNITTIDVIYKSL
jgi:hypothetical protein